jgi:FkbM family methyltransferase
LATRFGYTIVGNWRVNMLAQEAYVRELFELLQIDYVLDVGANRGQFRDFLRYRVGYDKWIISFEPIPDHADYLRQMSVGDPAWKIENYALGSQSGTAQFNVMKRSTFSSFLTPDHSHVSSLVDLNQVQSTIEVAVTRLDDVLPSLVRSDGRSRLYLKLDTQGFDLEVVKGSAKTLADVAALQTEASIVPIYAGMPDYITSIRTLEAHGFRLAGIFPVSPPSALQLLEVDCHMVNTRFG